MSWARLVWGTLLWLCNSSMYCTVDSVLQSTEPWTFSQESGTAEGQLPPPGVPGTDLRHGSVECQGSCNPGSCYNMLLSVCLRMCGVTWTRDWGSSTILPVPTRHSSWQWRAYPGTVMASFGGVSTIQVLFKFTFLVKSLFSVSMLFKGILCFFWFTGYCQYVLYKVCLQ